MPYPPNSPQKLIVFKCMTLYGIFKKKTVNFCQFKHGRGGANIFLILKIFKLELK